METEKYACQGCSRWRPNTAGILDCTEHVNGAPRVRECRLFEYEPGADASEEPLPIDWDID